MIGREAELQKFFDTLAQDDPRVVCVRGATGRGKSEFLREIALRLRAGTERATYRPAALQHANLVCGLREIATEYEDRAYSLVSVLLQVGAAVSQVTGKKPNLALIAEAEGKRIWESAGELASAVVSDFVTTKAPETAAKVAELLGGILPNTSLEKTLQTLLGEHRRPDVEEYVQLLTRLGETAPDCRFVLLFDNVQIASDMLCAALKYLARRVPERFYLVYAFNDESPEGREFEKRHWGDLKALGQAEIEVPRMTALELRRWIEATKGSSTVVSHELLERVCEVTDGRPFFMGRWMNSKDFERGRIERPDHLDGYLREDFQAISAEARKLVQLAAMLPGPLPRGCADYAAIFGTDVTEIDSWVLELSQHQLFAESRERPWFRHSLVQSYIVKHQLTKDVRKSLAKQAVEGLKANA